jgi:hypothetical protein
VGFESGTQGSPDLCASALTTAPRDRQENQDNIFKDLKRNKNMFIIVTQTLIFQSF